LHRATTEPCDRAGKCEEMALYDSPLARNSRSLLSSSLVKNTGVGRPASGRIMCQCPIIDARLRCDISFIISLQLRPASRRLRSNLSSSGDHGTRFLFLAVPVALRDVGETPGVAYSRFRGTLSLCRTEKAEGLSVLCPKFNNVIIGAMGARDSVGPAPRLRK